MNTLSSDFPNKERYDFDDLLALVRFLRSPDGCPWDRAQTHASVRKNLLEEAYEVAEGIDRDDPAVLREELGDFLFQALFHTVIEEEQGRFTTEDVLDAITRKMVHRHPHLFGEVSVSDGSAVPDLWEKVKKEEKGHATATDALRDVPKALPALMYAQKLATRAARAGFTYDTAEEAAEKVGEEWRELAEAKDPAAVEEEYGDLLFALVNYGRMRGLDAEEALSRASKKFLSRFEGMESFVQENGRNPSQCTKNELILAWKRAKER
ncbi:MAG: nucleoside triphosphate pyrophosphohydrolase [Clostridia bacterium]|nr:nucleoside triphosphate pyrophosphohydrolase [Clostridia bacterium]